MAASAPAKRTVISLLQRSWNEIPDIVGGSILALVGITIGTIGLVKYYANDCDNRRYKQQIVIMRPEDPRVAKIHKD